MGRRTEPTTEELRAIKQRMRQESIWPVAAADGKADMKRLKPHPAAEIFEMMSDKELDELAADIKAKGQLEPITVTTEGLILDGRNRYEACRRAGVAVKCEEWHVAGSPTAWVLSKNLHRRHLTIDQRAVVALEAEAMFAEEAKERQRAAGGDRKSPAAKADRLPSRDGKRSERAPTSAHLAARAAGVSGATVERVKRLKAQRPEMLDQVKKGGLSIGKAIKALVKEQRLKEVLEYKPPTGRYAVIVADPPWRYDDELDGSDAARGGLQYPTMSVDEICAMKVGDNLATESCALWLWVTTAFLIDGTAATVLRAWGFEPKTMLTWVKDRWGAGRYLRNQTEHCILAVRGKPLVVGQSQSTVLNAPRRGHSEKPAEAFEVFNAVTPCAPDARLELFARAERPHWVTSGAEVKPPSKKAGLHEMPMEWEPSPSAVEVLKWREEKGGRLSATGPSGYGYWIGAHSQGLPLKNVTAWNGTGQMVSTADLPDMRRAKDRAEEWERNFPPAAGAELAKGPAAKKRRLPPIVDVPPEPTKGIPFDAIAWTEKKHPSKVATGIAPSGRKYFIEKHSKISAQGKKVDGYTFRWFGPSGTSSLEDFSTVRDAQANAGAAEQKRAALP